MPIFFSLDPKAFTHYKSCQIDNGTTIYSNHSIPSDCSCVAPIASDPDFAGPGVIASFVFLAWLSIFVATIPAFYVMREEWQRSKPPWRVVRFAAQALATHVHDGEKRESGDRRVSRAGGGVVLQGDESEETFAGTVEFDEKKRIDTPSPSPRIMPKAQVIALALLQSLIDIQTVTGLAIIMSAFAQIRRITFYHEQFAVNLWWLTLNSVWVSRIDYNEDSPSMGTWRIQARRLAILASVAMSAVLQMMVTLREHNHWDPLNGRRCYVGSALGNNFGQNVFWFVGTLLYGTVLALGVFKSTRRWLDRRVFGRIPQSLAYLYERMKTSYSLFRTRNSLFGLLRVASHGVTFVTWWAVVQFLSIWSAGNTSHALELIVYTVFAGSNTWWVIALKVNNVHLVQGNENRWTLGQSLPVLLTGLVGFAALDAVG